MLFAASRAAAAVTPHYAYCVAAMLLLRCHAAIAALMFYADATFYIASLFRLITPLASHYFQRPPCHDFLLFIFYAF